MPLTVVLTVGMACGSRTPVVSLASLFNHCDAFADTTMKTKEKALLAGFGALISEMAQVEPVHPRTLRNQIPNANYAVAAPNDVTRRKGPYSDDHIEPGWNAKGASQDCIQEDWCTESVHEGRGARIHCSFTHLEIGKHIGLSRETVTRTINDFKSAGLVEQRGTFLIVPDRNALAVYAGIDLISPPRSAA